MKKAKKAKRAKRAKRVEIAKRAKKTKKIKKVIIAIIVIIAIGMIIWRIDDTETGISLNKNNTQTEEMNTKDVYQFYCDGKIINLGEEYDKEKLGEEITYYEIKEWSNDTINKVYVFEKYEITTYVEDGKDKIKSIYVLNEDLETEEGIKIGDTFEQMKEKYGEDFYNVETTYTYKKEKTSINFIIINDYIVSIEYQYLLDEE